MATPLMDAVGKRAEGVICEEWAILHALVRMNVGKTAFRQSCVLFPQVRLPRTSDVLRKKRRFLSLPRALEDEEKAPEEARLVSRNE